MKEELLRFISDAKFPCVMAKAVARSGNFRIIEVNDLYNDVSKILNEFYSFIDSYRRNSQKLSSFVISLNIDISFEDFEYRFWSFLKELNRLDKSLYQHDPRVASDPQSPEYGFSVKEEAFFILALHPESPRFARRFKHPLIVFNPHQQFENLRTKGVYAKIRDMIRKKDKLLQGDINPMLKDFGEASEIYQYTGRKYSPDTQLTI